jgi:hypothetical protein
VKVARQISRATCAPDTPAERRHLKRVAARRMRRLARLLGEDAPRAYRFAGWWS